MKYENLLRKRLKEREKESKKSGFLSAEKTDVLLQINARLQPMHRWEIYEKFIA